MNSGNDLEIDSCSQSKFPFLKISDFCFGIDSCCVRCLLGVHKMELIESKIKRHDEVDEWKELVYAYFFQSKSQCFSHVIISCCCWV